MLRFGVKTQPVRTRTTPLDKAAIEDTINEGQNTRVGIPISVVHFNRFEAATAVGQLTRWRCASKYRNTNSNQTFKASGTNFELEDASMTNVPEEMNVPRTSTLTSASLQIGGCAHSAERSMCIFRSSHHKQIGCVVFDWKQPALLRYCTCFDRPDACLCTTPVRKDLLIRRSLLTTFCAGRQPTTRVKDLLL